MLDQVLLTLVFLVFSVGFYAIGRWANREFDSTYVKTLANFLCLVSISAFAVGLGMLLAKWAMS